MDQSLLRELQACLLIEILLSSCAVSVAISNNKVMNSALTRKRAETVWKEDPFFLPPFLPPPASAKLI